MSDAVATSQQGLAGKYPPYPEYKDSGVEWLGDVPTDWRVIKLGFLATKIGSGKTPSGGATVYVDDGITFLRSQNVYDDGLRLDDVVHITPDVDMEMAHSRVKPMDILINITGASIGRTCIVPLGIGSANVNQHVCIIRLNKSEIIRFVSWAVKAQSTKAQIDNAQTGAAREGLNFEQIASLLLSLPPETECEQISNFLDYETARIDRLIAQQQRLIELLKEKRQAVISHAVTKGLNPNAPMKDSGVEWIGQVPEHWEALPIKYVSWFVGTGGTPKDRDSFTDENEINWFTPGDFNGELVLDDSGKYVTKGSILSGDAKIYPAESVLIVGIGATLGKVGVCNFKFSCNQQINIVTPNRKIAVDFLAFSLLAQTEQMKQTSNASTIGIMNQEKTKGIQIAVPPVQEQTSLIIHLKKKLSDFSLTTSKAEQLIALLQERRSALISAAVTGKIDLRGWTPPAEEVAA
ncbi:TPA: restriction endonuclease subunit S [Aeromonas veronii]